MLNTYITTEYCFSLWYTTLIILFYEPKISNNVSITRCTYSEKKFCCETTVNQLILKNIPPYWAKTLVRKVLIIKKHIGVETLDGQQCTQCVWIKLALTLPLKVVNDVDVDGVEVAERWVWWWWEGQWRHHVQVQQAAQMLPKLKVQCCAAAFKVKGTVLRDGT
jgi:hypothetical protein